MSSRIPRAPIGVLVALALAAAAGTAPVAAAGVPSGERILGQSSIEPVYDDMARGVIDYVSTPLHVPDPVPASPKSWAPFYLPVYPAGSGVGTLLCMGVPGNCPDHDGIIAGAAQAISAELGFGLVYAGGVLGHDHLIAPPASGGDFNIAWEPVLVLFTNSSAADTEHLVTLAQIQAAEASGDVVLVPLPFATFHCSVVPAVVYQRGAPMD